MLKVYVVPENDSFGAKAKAWVKNRRTDVECWWDEHGETVVALTPVVVTGGTIIAKVIGKRVNLQKEQTLKDRFVYDTSLGHYWELKKKLTNSQWVEIENRRRAGESLGNILAQMGVLKGL